MDEQKLNRIRSFLNSNGADIDTLSKSRLAQLEKVDDAIQLRLEAINKAKDILKTSSINVSVISTDTGISRKTFYNNDLLRLYVESFSTSDKDKNVASSDYDKIKERNVELSKQIQDFVLRDVETENLRHENMVLQREIQNLQNRNQSLERQYEEIQNELSQAKRKLLEQSGHVIPFYPKTSK